MTTWRHPSWAVLALAAAFAGMVAAAALSGPAGISAPGKGTEATPFITKNGRVTFNASQAPTLDLGGGDRRTITSLIKVDRPLSYGEFRWNDNVSDRGRSWILVDLKKQMISAFREGDELGTAVILYGADEKPTPDGRFKILEKRREHRSNLYDAEMPYTIRLTNDGISIHASEVRPGAATHGCVGVPIGFASRLFDAVKRGDEVVIIGNDLGNGGTTPGRA